VDWPELSDHLLDADGRPARPGDLPFSRWSTAGRIAAGIPRAGDRFDPEALDALYLRIHTELQRLWEEFGHGERLLSVLRPLIAVLRGRGVPLRIVDIGTGLGFGIRWLAAWGDLGDDVELVGVDRNATLVRVAGELAREEGLPCRFVHGDAFEVEGATVYLSTGVVHHFRDGDLPRFFRHQGSALAMVHFDILPSWLTPLGAWMFHVARMREPLARHDGVRSALRAHPGEALLTAASSEGWKVALYDGRVPIVPVLRVMHAVVGVRDELADPVAARLGARLGPWR